MTTAYTLNNKKSPISDVDSINSAGPFAYGSGHVDPERAADPGLIYDIAADDYLKYICSLNYTSAEIALFTRGNFTCPKIAAFGAADLNYPSFAVNFKVPVYYPLSRFCLDGSLNETEVKGKIVVCRKINVSAYIQSENVKKAKGVGMIRVKFISDGVSVIVKPKILSFNKLVQNLSYKKQGKFLLLRKGLLLAKQLGISCCRIELEAQNVVTDILDC
ncbi:hypothetical protein Ddye_017948 [Dipteronia dyeriana]|uniref:Uncharacterized protein n=1 Tax=Dipteronia dyeriana TaxID=168575 RepID=A0AAD9X0A4_9ROSI|nr:hypothetical protein Ddye_017948 [Dipteronia dyeriana]